MRENFKYTDKDNVVLNVYKWIPQGAPKAALQIAHGMTETVLRYDEFAKFLNEQGFIVYGHDHRGHGLTAPSKEDLGFLGEENGFEWLVNDVYELTELIKKENPNIPVILFGHSMGSFVSQRYLELHGDEIDGIILSGTDGEPNKAIPFGVVLSAAEMKLLGKKHTSKVIDKLLFGYFNNQFKPTRTAYDWLCSVDEEVDKYIANEHCGFVCSSSFFNELFKGLRRIHRPENFNQIPKDLPIYIIAGEKDPVGRSGKGIRNLYDKLKEHGVKDVEYKLYANKRHEILNEDNKHEVMQDVDNWINQKIKFL